MGGWRGSTWVPAPLPQCGEARYQGVSRAAHACAERSMRFLDPIIHWPAKLPEVGAAWRIPAALLRCMAGGGQGQSWPFPLPRGGLVGWVLEVVAFWQPGNANPLGKLVLPGGMLGGWKTKLKIVSLGNGAGVEQKQPLLSIWAGTGGVSPSLLGLLLKSLSAPGSIANNAVGAELGPWELSERLFFLRVLPGDRGPFLTAEEANGGTKSDLVFKVPA